MTGGVVSVSVPDRVDLLVGAKIRDRRKYKAMSQPGLAKLIGVTYQQLQKYESGVNRVSASMLWRIACAVDAPVDYFFEGVDK